MLFFDKYAYDTGISVVIPKTLPMFRDWLMLTYRCR
jgi:hypothetical protein